MPEHWLIDRKQAGNLPAVAQHIKEVVIQKIQVETSAGVGGVVNEPWFLEKHLQVVEDRANWILDHCPEAASADRNEVLIAVYTHDLGRVMGWENAHHMASAIATRQWLIDNGLESEVADRIARANFRHRADSRKEKDLPQTLLEKIIASADALSHFDGCESGTIESFLERKGFWYLMWAERIKKGENDHDIIEFSLKKMQRDVSNKQGFDESRKRAEIGFKFISENATEILGDIRQVLS